MTDDTQAIRMTASFTIAGRDFDPEACTEKLACEPTRVWTQKRAALRNRRDLPNASWAVQEPWFDCDLLDTAARKVLDRVWPHQQAIIEFCSEHDATATIEIGVRVVEDGPEYTLSAATIEQMAALGAALGISIYSEAEEAEE